MLFIYLWLVHIENINNNKYNIMQHIGSTLRENMFNIIKSACNKYLRSSSSGQWSFSIHQALPTVAAFSVSVSDLQQGRFMLILSYHTGMLAHSCSDRYFTQNKT